MLRQNPIICGTQIPGRFKYQNEPIRKQSEWETISCSVSLAVNNREPIITDMLISNLICMVQQYSRLIWNFPLARPVGIFYCHTFQLQTRWKNKQECAFILAPPPRHSVRRKEVVTHVFVFYCCHFRVTAFLACWCFFYSGHCHFWNYSREVSRTFHDVLFEYKLVLFIFWQNISFFYLLLLLLYVLKCMIMYCTPIFLCVYFLHFIIIDSYY